MRVIALQIFLMLPFISTTYCAIKLGIKYVKMRSEELGELRKIMYYKWFSLAFCTFMWMLAGILSLSGVFEPIPIQYRVMSFIAMLPFMFVAHWKYLYILKTEKQTKEKP